MRYEYSVLRFVPDTLRGEFVNLGVIVGSDHTGEWELRTAANMKRARSIDSEAVMDSAMSVVVDLQRRFDEHQSAIEEDRESVLTVSATWLREIAEQSRNLIQITPPSVVSADSVEEAMGLLFHQLVLDEEVAARARYVPRSKAVNSMARAYRQLSFRSENLGLHADVTTGKSAELFDFVVANGHAVQLTEAFSFAITGIHELRKKVKSWSWTVRGVRENGGIARMGNRQVGIPEDVEVAAVVVPPEQSNAAGRDAFDEAVAAFETNHVIWVPLDRAGEIAHRAALLLGSTQK